MILEDALKLAFYEDKGKEKDKGKYKGKESYVRTFLKQANTTDLNEILSWIIENHTTMNFRPNDYVTSSCMYALNGFIYILENDDVQKTCIPEKCNEVKLLMETQKKKNGRT
jgi:hypothetical protein